MKKYIVSEKRLKELLKKEEKLSRLECAGVDNWDGYAYAFSEEINEMFEETEDILSEFEIYEVHDDNNK